MKHQDPRARHVAVMLAGILVIVWMFSSHPAEARLPMGDSATVDPAIQGDISSAAWSAKCFPVPPTGEESAIDPILHWGPASTAPHTHEFFAQQTINSTSSPGALMAPTAAPTACYGPTHIPGTPACTYLSGMTLSVCDKSAYWVPALLYDLDPTNTANTAIPARTLSPGFMNIYWRNEYTDPLLDSSFPENLAIVAGNANATSPQNIWVVNWQCVSPQSRDKWQTPGRYQSTIPSSCLMPSDQICPSPDHAYPDHCYPVLLRMVVTFPECVKLTTNATQGMVTPVATRYGVSASPTPPPPDPRTPSSYINCPPIIAGTPWLQIPPIQVDPHWSLNNAVNGTLVPETPTVSGGTTYIRFDTSKLLLSSDLMMDQSPGMPSVTPGTTSHADYENGYRQADIDGLIAGCFHETATPGGINCGSQ